MGKEDVRKQKMRKGHRSRTGLLPTSSKGKSGVEKRQQKRPGAILQDNGVEKAKGCGAGNRATMSGVQGKGAHSSSTDGRPHSANKSGGRNAGRKKLTTPMPRVSSTEERARSSSKKANKEKSIQKSVTTYLSDKHVTAVLADTIKDILAMRHVGWVTVTITAHTATPRGKR